MGLLQQVLLVDQAGPFPAKLLLPKRRSQKRFTLLRGKFGIRRSLGFSPMLLLNRLKSVSRKWFTQDYC